MRRQIEEARLVGVGRGLFWGLGDRRLVHHQKMPPPSNAIMIRPTIVIRMIHRMASRAIRTNIASRTIPPMIKIVSVFINQLVKPSSRF